MTYMNICNHELTWVYEIKHNMMTWNCHEDLSLIHFWIYETITRLKWTETIYHPTNCVATWLFKTPVTVGDGGLYYPFILIGDYNNPIVGDCRGLYHIIPNVSSIGKSNSWTRLNPENMSSWDTSICFCLNRPQAASQGVVFLVSTWPAEKKIFVSTPGKKWKCGKICWLCREVEWTWMNIWMNVWMNIWINIWMNIK